MRHFPGLKVVNRGLNTSPILSYRWRGLVDSVGLVAQLVERGAYTLLYNVSNTYVAR